MLWLCISLPQLPLESLQAHDNATPTVVTACEGSTRWTICCNQAAVQRNLKESMNYTAALAICPDVLMVERRIDAERAALERLAGWAYQFSSTVILDEISSIPHRARNATLWLEIGASLKLFGGFRKLLEHLEDELEQLNYSYRLGIAPTLEGAALLARAEVRVATTTLQTLHARIRYLSIHRLSLPTHICQQLSTAGVRSIGLLLDLPRDAIAKRFGPETSEYLDRLIGDLADPRPTFKLPHRYDVRFEFEFESKNTESMLFPLKRMLREFSGFLRGHDVCIQTFFLSFMHREVPATPIRIGLSLPDRDPERFLALVREKLERTELPAPTQGLRLVADQFAAPTTLQSDLFDSVSKQNEELTHTIDRLAARLGNDQIHALRICADHRPERSWEAASFTEKSRSWRFPERPLWLLPEPKPLQLSAMPQITSAPERIESGWWDAREVQRDYYIVRTSNGAALWVYRELGANGKWYLHGFWS